MRRIQKKLFSIHRQKVKKIWRERDGVRYSAALPDKVFYVWKYHRTEIENIAVLFSATAGVIISLAMLQ